MPGKINKERLKAFITRRKTNALGLTIITASSILITLYCTLTGFKRADILVLVTIALVALCLLQFFKTRKFFRTMKSFKGWRKKSKQ